MARAFVTPPKEGNDIRREPTAQENPGENAEGNSGPSDTCISVVKLFGNNIKCRGDLESPDENTEGGDSSPYSTCFNLVKLLSKTMLIVLGLGSTDVQKIRKRKEKHIYAVQIMDKLLEKTVMYEYEDSGMNPLAAQKSPSKDGETTPYLIFDGGDLVTPGSIEDKQVTLPRPINDNEIQEENKGKGVMGKGSSASTEKKPPEMEKKETPILIAAKNGVTEMVEKILEIFPVAIHDLNADKKNIVLLAVENRQPHVYQLLQSKSIMKDSVFCKVDKDGNSALHLAARLGEYKPWMIPGAALQMQWEIKCL